MEGEFKYCEKKMGTVIMDGKILAGNKEDDNMLYPFMTLNDNTEIVHSEILNNNGKEEVKVCIERPVFEGFQSIECYLPEYNWKNNEGFTQEDIEEFQELLESTAHIIIALAREGGLDNASNF